MAARTPTPTPTPDFSLISALRYDPILIISPDNTPTPSPFYLLQYHLDRLLRAAHTFNWPSSSLTLDLLQHACETAVGTTTTPLKLRILFSHTGTLTVEVAPVPSTLLGSLLPTILPAPGKPPKDAWRVRIDTASTSPSPYTSHKTTQRAQYDAARERAGIVGSIEVVLWNEDGECMEGSITSLYFWREIKPASKGTEEGKMRWVTPALSSGGNNGTTRRWFLERGIVSEGVVLVKNIRVGETVLMSNGVRGIWAGVVEPINPDT